VRCPVCNVELKMTERQGIEIDYCPQCRGVWLDRGELDKMIERSASISSQRDYERRPHERREYDDEDYYKKKKRKSFLSDIFDL
jgi:Zn-finger nucleic acid-binding protein